MPLFIFARREVTSTGDAISFQYYYGMESEQYVVCKKEGFDVSRFSFDRMPESFAGMEPQAGRNELTRVRNVSSDILENMNAKLEQQRDKASRQPER